MQCGWAWTFDLLLLFLYEAWSECCGWPYSFSRLRGRCGIVCALAVVVCIEV